MSDPVPAAVPTRDAATVMLVRDGPRGIQTCLLRRADSAGFVPGVHVFPGGAIDPGDTAVASMIDGVGDSEASRLTGVRSGGLRFWAAAVRECLEETGVAPAVIRAEATSVDLSRWRREIHGARIGLGSVLDAEGARIDGASIRCFARWVTPLEAPRRFDTRFFLARMPEDAIISADGSELVDHQWIEPSVALQRSARGELTMILPTIRSLSALARFDDSHEAMRCLRFGVPGQALLPDVFVEHGRRMVRVPDDPEGTGGVYDGETGMPVS